MFLHMYSSCINLYGYYNYGQDKNNFKQIDVNVFLGWIAILHLCNFTSTNATMQVLICYMSKFKDKEYSSQKKKKKIEDKEQLKDIHVQRIFKT